MKDALIKLLIAGGLTKETATVFAGIASITDATTQEEVNSMATNIIAAQPQAGIDAAEVDRRVTQGVQTALDNYEKKHGLKDGVKVDTPPPATTPPSANISPEMKLLMDNQAKMQEMMMGFVAKNAAAERQVFVKNALTAAKINPTAHGLFKDNPEATEEEFKALVTEFSQTLSNMGIAALAAPGAGDGDSTVMEATSAQAAEARNSASTPQAGVIVAKEI